MKRRPFPWGMLLVALTSSCASGQVAARRWSRPKVLDCEGGVAVVRFDLSDLPAGAKVHRADLRIARASEPTGLDDDGQVDILIYPLMADFRPGGPLPTKSPPVPLKLRGPWFDRFDATRAVGEWAGGRTHGGFFAKACPRMRPEGTCLDVVYEGAAGAGKPPQATGLKAVHRAGQTFITWKEIEDLAGADALRWRELKAILEKMDAKREVRYCVYRSDRPITAATLHRAERIATVRPLSGWNVNGRNIERPIDEAIATKDYLPHGHGNPFGRADADGPYGLDCPIDRLVIEDGGKPLPRGTGLYVHTPGRDGRAYYAVATSIDGAVNTSDFSKANSLASPVAEVAGQGEPVLQGELPAPPLWSYPGKRLHYVRWVAPPLVNRPSEHYNWSVALPEKLDKGRALELCFHRDGGSYWRTHYRIERDSIVLCPHDFPFPTWWYGYHESVGTLRSFRQGLVRNYTERRLLAFVDWAARKWPVERDRILVTGVRYSGGSGALHLGLRHPEVFALVCSGHGLPDYAAAVRDSAGQRRAKMMDSFQRLCGKLQWDLKTDTGRSVWEEMDLTKRVTELPAKAELPLVGMSAQHYVAWGLWPGYHRFFQAMLAKRRAICATFSWYGDRIVVVSRTSTSPRAIRLDVARNRSRLAFQGPGTKILDKEGGGMGEFNMAFRWRDVVDEPDRYEVTVFFAGRGKTIATPVTLRNLQKFRVAPGRTYKWVGRGPEGEAKSQNGRVTVGDDGLLTIPGFQVHQAGTRLVVTGG